MSLKTIFLSYNILSDQFVRHYITAIKFYTPSQKQNNMLQSIAYSCNNYPNQIRHLDDQELTLTHYNYQPTVVAFLVHFLMGPENSY